MTEPKELLGALSLPFPAHALKQRQGGSGQQFTYVEAETVIRRLNAVAGSWDFKMTHHEWRPVVEYQDKDGKRRESQTLVVYGELTIAGLGTRSGTGVQTIDPQSRASEDMIKGAMSDCLKKAATLFNVGIDLYGPDLEAGEIRETMPLPARSRTTSVNTVPNDQPTATGWTQFWTQARRAGLNTKPDAVKAIGDLGADPDYALERLAAWEHDNATQPSLAS